MTGRARSTCAVAVLALTVGCTADEERARELGRRHFDELEQHYRARLGGELVDDGTIAGVEAAIAPASLESTLADELGIVSPGDRSEPATAGGTPATSRLAPAAGRGPAPSVETVVASATVTPGRRAQPNRTRSRVRPTPARNSTPAVQAPRRPTPPPIGSTPARRTPIPSPTPSPEPPGSDAKAPQLYAISFEPAEAADGSDVMVRIIAEDDLSGVNAASGALSSPSRKVFIPFSLTVDAATGELAGRLKVPPRAEAGSWSVSNLRVTDRAHNTAVLTPRDDAVVASARLTVYSTSSDSAAPRLESIELRPPEIEDGGQVRVIVGASDDGSGVSSVRGILANPSGKVQLNFYPRLNKETQLYEGAVSLPKHSEYGDWKVTLLTLTDGASNRNTIKGDDPMLGRAIVRVLSSSQDTIAPELVAISLQPDRVEDGATVDVSVIASDDLSGVKGIDGWVVSPNKSARIHFSLRKTGDSGEWRGTVRVPRRAANGMWRVDRLSVSDHAQNRTLLQAGDPVLTSATFEVYSTEN